MTTTTRIDEPRSDGAPRTASGYDREAGTLVRPQAPRPRGRSRALTFTIRCAGPVLLLAIWWAGTATGLLSDRQIASPEQVWRAFTDLVSSGQLQHHVAVSLGRAGKGLLIGGTLGLVLGVVAGMYALGEELLDPSMQMLRTIPFIALTPLFIIWFGIGETSKVTLIALACAFPMYLNAYSGVRNVDRKVLEAGRSFGLSKPRLAVEVVLPAALPSILVGLRYAMGVAILALIAAEQINSSAGIGFLMTRAREFLQIDVLLVGILVYAALGLAGDLIVRVLERTLMPWQRHLVAR